MEKYSSKYNYMQTNIDVRELLIRLLSQWKAALIFALLAAIAITGWKYSKSMAAYNSQKQASENAAAQTSSAEDIQKIYDNLGEDRYLVELVLSQDDLLEKENDYYQNSILMNTDFDKVRTMNVQYALTYNDENADDTALTKAYDKYVKSEEFAEGLASIIGETEHVNYISELVFCDKIYNEDVYDTPILDINIILPENVDAAAVGDYVTKQIEAYSEDAREKCGEHKLTHLRSEEKECVYNELADKQYAVVSNIHNLQTSIRTNKTAMTEAQKAAYNSIKSATASVKAATGTQDEPVKPSISKKHAIFGFALGLMIYVIFAFLLMANRRKVKSLSEAELYSGQKSLGELYYSRSYHGLNALFHSNIVNRILRRKPDDPDTKLDRISKLITMVSGKNNIEEITLANIGSENELGNGYAEQLREKLTENGLTVKMNNVSEESAEADFLEMNNAIIIVHGDETSESDLLRFTDFCDNFSINRCGIVYMQSI